MTYMPRCSDLCCPEPVDVTVNATHVYLNDNEIAWMNYTIPYVSGTIVYTLPAIPVSASQTIVFVNNLPWRNNVDYIIEGAQLTLVSFIADVPPPSIYIRFLSTSSSGALGVDVSTILTWGGDQTACPSGFLFCDGTTIGRAGSGADHCGSIYEDLFNAIQDQYEGSDTYSATSYDDGDVMALPTVVDTMYDGAELVTRKAMIKY